MVKVVLTNKNKKLTGTGRTFEYLLMVRGWNDLPKEKQYGLIRNDYTCWNPAWVTFPHVEPPMKLLLFSDEYKVQKRLIYNLKLNQSLN